MSESEEMYIITIATLQEADRQEKAIPLPLLAAELNVTPVSANQMIRKLEETGLVEYLPYKGTRLTQAGWTRARSILRPRRLWEVFLVEKLHLSHSEAEALACRFEHLTPPEVADRLEEFLGMPRVNPQGKIIPAADGNVTPVEISLSELPPGHTAVITRLEGCQATRSFLAEGGIKPGEVIQLEASTTSGALLVKTSQTRMALTAEAARAILIHRP